MTIHRLICVSHAVPGLEPPDEMEVAELTRINARRGVTGILLFADCWYFQCIEGREALLEGVFKRICADPRHRDVRLILKEKDSSRFFSNWSAQVTECKSIQGRNNHFITPVHESPHEFKEMTPQMAVAIARGLARVQAAPRSVLSQRKDAEHAKRS